MAFTEDLAPFFTDFGVSALVGGVACTGIFDNVYAATLGYVSGTEPMLLVRASLVPLVAIGNSVAIGVTSYTVTGIKWDNEADKTQGLVMLFLDSAA
jgi:hypothetical protein